MSIELLNKEHLMAFKSSVENTKNRIRIVSPFIGFETSKLLAESLKGSQVECTIITRFYREDFINHASSLDGLKILTEAGIKVYALQGLHTKLYIFDGESAILGSANFTMGGFRYNHELSLMIEDETELISQLGSYCDELLGNIEATGNWLLDGKTIEDEMQMVDQLIKRRKDKNTTYRNTTKYGAVLTDQSEEKETDEIEKVLREGINSGANYGIWLKFVGTGDDRYDPNAKYSSIKLRTNGKSITSFPRNPRGISDGDYIYLAAISRDKLNMATPIIVGRAKTKGFNAKNVATVQDCKQFGWMQEYPYYIELYDVEVLNVEVKNCISLDKLIRELGPDLYPTTQGQTFSVPELKSRHYRKSHLRLTPAAKQYIDKLFDDLTKQYGVIK